MNEVPTFPLPQPGWSMRAWRAGDVAALAQAANDERILQWMSDTWPSPYTEGDARWWIETGQHASGMAWALCQHDVPRGGAGLHPRSGFLRCNGEVGWWLHPDHWGQGVVPAAAAQVVQQAFALPEVTRVFAPIHAGNARSVRVAEKVGMRLEAVQPRSAFKRGQVIDRVVYAAYC
ncbi:MAG: GNAT family N-acetyltransferase [Rubrivivax sp.]